MPIEHLRAALLDKVTDERTTAVRNTFLGGAALSTGILIALTQVGARELALKIAVVACSVAAPLWLCLATVLEAYLHLGEELKTELIELRTGMLYSLMSFAACVSLYVAICGVVAFLFSWALYVFLFVSALSLVYVWLTYARIVKRLMARAIHCPAASKCP